jgi:hypothetical protein
MGILHKLNIKENTSLKLYNSVSISVKRMPFRCSYQKSMVNFTESLFGLVRIFNLKCAKWFQEVVLLIKGI